MAQCKKILDNGERCSNRAVPGTDYCEQHRRIQFRKVSKAPSIPTPPPEKQKKKKTEKIVEVPQWVARPSAAGEESKFPGLRVDGRNILVAPQGLIWLSEQGSEEHPGTLFDRLVKLLACLSQDMPLPDHVSVWLMPEGAGALVRLTPSTSSGQASSHHEQVELSRHYDVAASAVALSEGLLYIGEERLFIRYRDGGAPRGYDAEDVKAPKGDDLYLIDLDGTHLLFPTSMIEEALADLLLRIAPLPLRGAELPEAAFVLVTPPLYRMLAHYFRDHHLRYRVARFFPTPSFAPPPNLPPQGGGTVPTPGPSHLSACGHAQAEEGNIHSPGPPQGGKSASPIPSHQGRGTDPLMLFEIAPRPDAPAGTFVPKFVLSYLSDLPCCTVFTEAGAVEGRRMLVEWGQRYPCLPRNILQAFASDSLCLFTSSPDFPNLCLCPAPTFFEGDELIAAQVPRPEHIEMAPIPDQEDLPIDLPVRLIPDSGPTPSTAALILDAEETVWVRRLLYRLPGQAFGAYSLCLGQESSVLLGEGMPVELLPFGSPMRRVQDTQLFLPLRTRLIPDLPWNVLAEVLEMKDNVYTFLTLDFRLDLPRNAFAPLSKALVAESGRPRVAFDLCPTPDLPELKWTGDRGQLAVGSRQSAVGNLPLAPPRREKRQGAKGRGQKAEGSGKHPPAPPQEGKPTPAPSQEGNMEEMLRERAESFRQDRDHLSAAFCFALAGDNTNAARCYQEAAQHAKAGK